MGLTGRLLDHWWHALRRYQSSLSLASCLAMSSVPSASIPTMVLFFMMRFTQGGLHQRLDQWGLLILDFQLPQLCLKWACLLSKELSLRYIVIVMENGPMKTFEVVSVEQVGPQAWNRFHYSKTGWNLVKNEKELKKICISHWYSGTLW